LQSISPISTKAVNREFLFSGTAIALSIAVQVISALRLGSQVNGPDAATYVSNADSFKSFDSLFDPTSFAGNYWAPGYSWVLNLLDFAGDNQLILMRLIQTIAVISTAMMIAYLARPFSQMGSRLALLLVLFSPSLLWYSSVIGYEIVLMFLITFSYFLLKSTQLENLNSGVRVALAGLSLSYATVVQSRVLLIVPIFIFIVVHQECRKKWRKIGLFLTTVSIFPFLWALRNLIALGSFTPWTTNGAINVWIGNNPDATGGYIDPPAFPAGWPQDFIGAALHFAINSPREFFAVQVQKVFYLFSPNMPLDYRLPFPVVTEWLGVGLSWAWIFLVITGIVFFVSAMLWKISTLADNFRSAGIIALTLLLLNLPFLAQPRYRIPVEPLLVLVVSLTFVSLIQKRRSGRLDNSMSHDTL